MKFTNNKGETAELKATAMVGDVVLGHALDLIERVKKSAIAGVTSEHGLLSLIKEFETENDLVAARHASETTKNTITNNWPIVVCSNEDCGVPFFKYYRTISSVMKVHYCNKACQEKAIEKKRLIRQQEKENGYEL